MGTQLFDDILYYAGIGSRETPEDVCEEIKELAWWLRQREWILRSGGAGGADKAFEDGILGGVHGKDMEIYLPWKKFNHNESHLSMDKMPKDIVKQAEELAKEHLGTAHWNNCSYGAKRLHTRNVFQVLGQDLDTPVKMVICWTWNGQVAGGTGQAMRVAKSRDIQIFNLKFDPIQTVKDYAETFLHA